MLRDFSKEEFDIVIQAGQSNSEGSGVGPVETTLNPTGDILYLQNDFTISMAQELVYNNEIYGNFSLAFCRKYIESGKLQAGRKLLVIRAAIGGTGFLDHRWGMTDDLYLRMLEMIRTALELNPKNKLVTFLWHQGETDANLNATQKVHYDNLTGLINSVRNIYNYKDLPFIAGDFVKQWKDDNIERCIPVVAAIKEVCASIGHARFVETDELLSNDQKLKNGDTIHFCRDALNKLGVKYYDAYCDIVG